jgi:ribose transport system substrate-binding protein
MGKRISKFLIAAAVLAMVCTGAYAGGSKDTSGAVKVGFIVGSREHVFYTLIEQGIKAEAQKLGIQAVVLDGNLDGNVTSDHINNLVAEGCKAVALSVNDPGGTTPAIEAANRAGVPVFTFDCTSSTTTVIKAFVGTDNVEGGRLGGRETVRLAAAGQKVGLINYDEPQSCLDRRAGWEEIVKASDKGLKIVEVGNYQGDAAKAEQLTTDALTANPDLAVIFCVGDPAAAGALAAIKAAGTSTLIIGFDGNPEAKAAIKDATNGKIWVSEISQNPIAIGSQITGEIKGYLDTGKVTKEVAMIAPYIITIANVND